MFNIKLAHPGENQTIVSVGNRQCRDSVDHCSSNRDHHALRHPNEE